MKCPICDKTLEYTGDGFKCGCGEVSDQWTFMVLPLPAVADETIRSAFKRGVDGGEFSESIYGFALFIECLCADYLAGA